MKPPTVQGTQHEQDWSPWLYLALEWGESSDDGLDLLLTINFHRHYLEMLGGKIWFGLRGAELQMAVTNGMMPNEHRWPDTPLQSKLEIKRSVSETHGSTQSEGARVGFTASLKKAGATAADNTTDGEAKSSRTQDDFEFVDWQVSHKGSDTTAYWEFETRTGQPYLQASLVKQKIAVLTAIDHPCILQATVTVFKKDIYPLGGEGLWKEDLTKAKKSIVLALLRKGIVKKMQPLVSLELQYPHPETG